jgi:uncharacterized protein YPO0396
MSSPRCDRDGDSPGEAALCAPMRTRRIRLSSRAGDRIETLREALSIEETVLSFAGELIEVRGEERDWEGAAERLLHGFAQSLLVPDALYAQVSDWVDRTHLAGLVYFRVRPGAHPIPLAAARIVRMTDRRDLELPRARRT